MSIVKDGVMLVTYETECSTICEYMTETEFNILKKDELNGKIRIMGHGAPKLVGVESLK